MKVAVIGHTGMGGSAVTAELVRRGHQVRGLSFNANDVPAPAGVDHQFSDVFDGELLRSQLAGQDVVVSAYSGGHGLEVDVYYRQAEGTRRIIKAVRDAKVPYLIYIGGAASLFTKPGVQFLEDERWPRWFYGTQPPVHQRWLGDLIPAQIFHDSADRKEAGLVKPGESDVILEEQVKDWKHVALLEGCRVALDMFEGRTDFAWSFLSPPWMYRPGPGTGSYELGVDFMIWDEGIPSGIDVPDLALAVCDEVENRRLVHKHWTCAGRQAKYAVDVRGD